MDVTIPEFCTALRSDKPLQKLMAAMVQQQVVALAGRLRTEGLQPMVESVSADSITFKWSKV